MEGDGATGKRSWDEYSNEKPGEIGVGETVALLRRQSQDQGEQKQEKVGVSTNGADGEKEDGAEDWQKVDRASKRRKKNDANYPAISHAAHARLQSIIKISDLQNLVLYLLADGNAPQWVSVRHSKSFEKVVVLMVPGLETGLFNGSINLEASEAETNTNGAENEENGTAANGEAVDGDPVKSQKPQHLSMSPDNYYPSKLATQKLPDCLKPLADMFPHIWPVKTPGDFNRMHSPLYAMLSSPIPRTKEEKKQKGPKAPAEGRNWKNVRTPMTEFILTREELAENGFALHPAHLRNETEMEYEKTRRYKACQAPEDGWTDILDIKSLSEGHVPDADVEKGSVTGGRQLLVVDCEMVTTTTDRFALARISMIDWNGKTVLDEFVKPPDPVKDYLTPFSGITKEDLDKATLTLSDIQSKLGSLLTPQTLLAGHSLDSDLRALKISYPFVIDTAVLYPHPKGPPQKSSLKWLTQKYLQREIQNRGGQGHDSVEDAQACLDLIRQKCEKGKTWGTPDATGEPIFRRLARYDSTAASGDAGKNLANSPSSTAGRTGAVVDWGDPMRGFGASATAAISCEDDGDVVDGMVRAVNGDGKASNIPSSGCDFVWGRLRELEAVRGWWSKSKSLDAQDRLARTLDAANGDAGTSDESESKSGELSSSKLASAVAKTVGCIQSVWDALPERTAFIVYSGGGDPKDMVRLQAMHDEYKRCYKTMKWDELPVKWTDVEQQGLKEATSKARNGVGFIGVK
ncbi:hypothetical protein MBLNU457_g0832t1 [Dothideomycetes sp. NU457]